MTTFFVSKNGSVTTDDNTVKLFRCHYDTEWVMFPLFEVEMELDASYIISWSQPTKDQTQHGGIFIDASNISPRTGGPTWWFSEKMHKFSPNNIDVLDIPSPVCQTITLRFFSNTHYTISSNVSGHLIECEYNCAPIHGILRIMYHYNPDFTSAHQITTSVYSNNLWSRLDRIEEMIQSINNNDCKIQQMIDVGYTYDNDDLYKWSEKYAQCIAKIGEVLKTKETKITDIQSHYNKKQQEDRREISKLRGIFKVLETYPELTMSIIEVRDIIETKISKMNNRGEIVDKCIQDLELFNELLNCTANCKIDVNESSKHIRRIYDDMPTFTPLNI